MPTRNPRDAEVTKTQILNAAEAEFATAGYLAARTEAIAAQTGVTKAMIYYYFGSKEGLYRAVLERAFSHPLNAIGQPTLEAVSPIDALETFLRQFLDQMAANPHLAALLCLESIQNQGQYYPLQTEERLYGTLQGILERGIQMGLFRPFDPGHTAINIIGSCVFYFSAHPSSQSRYAGQSMLGVEMLAQHTQAAIEFILAGVRRLDG